MSSTQPDNQPSSPLGEQELDVLRFVTDNAPTTARAAAELWGQPRGLAKSTVLTVMERLRAKGYLNRVKRQGSFEYSPAVPKNVLLGRLIHEFVQRTLGGSSSPLVQYLADRGDLTPSEMRILEEYADETAADDAKAKKTRPTAAATPEPDASKESAQ